MKFTTTILENILKVSLPFEDSFNKLVIDSRAIEPGDIFVGLKGKNSDGNRFAVDALKAGAKLCILDNKSFLQNERTILVDDSLEFLKNVGQFVLRNIKLKKLIAITGSVGKTTTKVWTNEILKKHLKSFASLQNFNTIFGIPLSLSMMPEETEYGIFELGTNNVGEIAELANFLTPDIGIITNIFESHIGRFNDKKTLIAEKLSITDGIKPGGVVIHNGDGEFLEELHKKAQAKDLKLISVGENQNCDFAITKFENSIVHLKTPEGKFEYKINSTGKHFAFISAIIAATLYAIGEKFPDFLGFFKELSPLSGRGKILNLKYGSNEIQIIDDSYNASPSSMLASIDILNSIPEKNKAAVIGQMGELGSFEEHYHKIVAQKLQDSKINQIVFVGDEKLWPIFQEPLNGRIKCFSKIDKIVIEKISKMEQNMSVVLLKGSRSVGLDMIVQYLQTKCSIA